MKHFLYAFFPRHGYSKKTNLTLEFRLSLNSRPIYPTTHSRCPMGSSNMSGHKGNFGSSLFYLAFSLTAFFISVTLDSTFLFFTLIIYRIFFTTFFLFVFNLRNIFFPTLSKMLKATFSGFTTLVIASVVPPLQY